MELSPYPSNREKRQEETNADKTKEEIEDEDDDDADTLQLLAQGGESHARPKLDKGATDQQAKKSLWPFLPAKPARRSGKGISTNSKISLASEPGRRVRKARVRRDGVYHFATNRGWSSL